MHARLSSACLPAWQLIRALTPLALNLLPRPSISPATVAQPSHHNQHHLLPYLGGSMLGSPASLICIVCLMGPCSVVRGRRGGS